MIRVRLLWISAFLMFLLSLFVGWQSGMVRGGRSVAGDQGVKPTNVSARVPPKLPVEDARQPFGFPDATVISEHRSEPDASGGVVKTQLLQTPKSSYPFVRVIEAWRDNERTERYAMVADHVLVRLRKERSEADLYAWTATVGLGVRRHLPDTDYYLLQLPDPEAFDEWLKRLGDDAALPIHGAQPDYLRFAATLPDDTRFAEQWWLNNTGQMGGKVDADVDAPEAWELAHGAAPVLVAVLDTGADVTHPDLVPNLWVNAREIPGNRIDDDSNGYVDDVYGANVVEPSSPMVDGDGHGTHCAGTVAARWNNGAGVSGVAPWMQVMPVRVSSGGDLSVSAEIAGFVYAMKNGAKVISLSFSGPGPVDPAERDLIAQARSAGVLVVVASGNESLNTDSHPQYPASFPDDNILSVGATGQEDTRPPFSNYGPKSVDLAAPGAGILSLGLGGTYRYESGTSMSTPMVAGACALVKAAHPELTYQQVRTSILNGVDLVPGWKGLSVTGGRLNVARAVKIGAGPYLETTTTVLADAKLYGANGNGDKLINPGEDISLTLTVRNLGATTATAATTTLSIIEGAASVSIVRGSKVWGSLAKGASLVNTKDPFILRIASGITTLTPFKVGVTHTAATGLSWTEEQIFTISGSQSVTGKVLTLTGSKPMSGAVVSYTGRNTGTVLTAKDGTYRLTLPDGTYTLSAKATGYSVSAAQTVTVPSEGSRIDFALGRPLISATPASVTMTHPEQGITTKTVTITNKGDLPLNLTLENNSGAIAISPSYYNTSSYGDVFRTAQAAIAPLPFTEGFEAKSSFVPSRYYRWWTETETTSDGYYEYIYTYIYVINQFVGSYATDATTAAVGTRSLRYREEMGFGFDNGMERRFAPYTQPAYVSFWMRSGSTGQTNGCFSLESAFYRNDPELRVWEYSPLIEVQAKEGGVLQANGDPAAKTTYTPNKWELVELRHIDWTAHTFDFWHNGQLIKAGIAFHAPTGSNIYQVSRAHLYNETADGQSWWDEIRLLNKDDTWLSSGPSQLSIAPGATSTISITGNAERERPGTYTGRVDVLSNDPTKPRLLIPVTMVVTPFANQAPLAPSLAVSTVEDTPVTITPAITDADGNPMTITVMSLPLKGTLRSGSSSGAIVPRAPYSLEPGVTSLVFIPDADVTGSPLTSFTYAASDYRLSSKVAKVAINVTPVADPPRAVDDYVYLNATAAVNIKVIANDVEPDGQLMNVTSVTQPNLGTVTLRSDFSVDYTPRADFTAGEDVFSYTVSDPDGSKSTAQVHILMGPMMGGDWPTQGGDFGRTNHRAGRLFGATLSPAWSVPTPSSIPVGIATLGGVAVTTAGSSSNGIAPVCSAYLLALGSPLWSRSLDGMSYVSAPTIHRDQVFVQTAPTLISPSTTPGKLWCLSLADGSVVWSVDTIYNSQPGSCVAVSEDRVIISGKTRVSGSAIPPLGIYDRLTGALVAQTSPRGYYTNGDSTAPTLTHEGLISVGQQLSVINPTTQETLRSTWNTGTSYSAGPKGILIKNGYVPPLWLPLATPGTFAAALTIPITAGSPSFSAVNGDLIWVLRSDNYLGCYDLKAKKVTRWIKLPYTPDNAPVWLDDCVIVSTTYYNTNQTDVYDTNTLKHLTTLPDAGVMASASGYLLRLTSTKFDAHRAFSASATGHAATAQTVTTLEDTPISITLSGTPLGAPLRPVLTAMPTGGTLYQTTDGVTRGSAITGVPAIVTNTALKVIFQPAQDLNGAGQGRFSFGVLSGALLSPASDVTVNISPVPDAPDLKDDWVFMKAGTTKLDIAPLANDREPDGETMTITSITQPTGGGVAAIVDDHTLSFASPSDANSKILLFTYTVTDSTGLSSTANIRVSTEGTDPNSWPTARGPSSQNKYSPVTLGTTPMQLVWTQPLSTTGGMVIGGGKVFVRKVESSSVYRASTIRALDLHRGGGRAWTFQNDNGMVGELAWHRGQLIAAAGISSSGGNVDRVLAFNDTDGTTAWQQTGLPSFYQGSSAAVITPSDLGIWVTWGSRYSVATGNSFLAYEPVTGAERFVSSRADSSLLWPTMAGDRLLANNGSALAELSIATGAERWTVQQSAASDGTQRMAFSGGRVFGVDSTSLWARRASDGTLLWRVAGSFQPLLAATPDAVYVALNYGGGTQAFHTSDGTLLGAINLSYVSDMVVTDDAIILISSYYRGGVYDRQTMALRYSLPTSGSYLAMAESWLVTSDGSSIWAYRAPSASNTAPVAQAQSVAATEELPTTITLAASDANSDSIGYVIRSLPSNAQLYQTADGTTKGAPITEANTLVTSATGQVIFEVAAAKSY